MFRVKLEKLGPAGRAKLKYHPLKIATERIRGGMYAKPKFFDMMRVIGYGIDAPAENVKRKAKPVVLAEEQLMRVRIACVLDVTMHSFYRFYIKRSRCFAMNYTT